MSDRTPPARLKMSKRDVVLMRQRRRAAQKAQVALKGTAGAGAKNPLGKASY